MSLIQVVALLGAFATSAFAAPTGILPSAFVPTGTGHPGHHHGHPPHGTGVPFGSGMPHGTGMLHGTGMPSFPMPTGTGFPKPSFSHEKRQFDHGSASFSMSFPTPSGPVPSGAVPSRSFPGHHRHRPHGTGALFGTGKSHGPYGTGLPRGTGMPSFPMPSLSHEKRDSEQDAASLSTSFPAPSCTISSGAIPSGGFKGHHHDHHPYGTGMPHGTGMPSFPMPTGTGFPKPSFSAEKRLFD